MRPQLLHAQCSKQPGMVLPLPHGTVKTHAHGFQHNSGQKRMLCSLCSTVGGWGAVGEGLMQAPVC